MDSAQLERVRAADPGQVVDELEHLVPVGVRTLGAVSEAVVPRDVDGRNAPRLRRSGSDAGDAKLGHDVALVRQLASVGVEEGVEPETELIEHGRRQRARIANHHLVHAVEQLRAVQLQRRRHLIVVAVAIAAHPRRRRVLHEVHALRELLPVDRAILLGEVIEASASRLVRRGIELEQLLRGRVNAIGRNTLPGKVRQLRVLPLTVHVAGSIERRGDRREIAASHRLRRQVEVVQVRLPIDVALVVRHEEQPVPHHRAAGRVAELMPIERRLRCRGLSRRERVRTRVELVVAVEFEHGAMKGIRTRLGDDVHLAGGAAELGRVDAGLHFEFLERVDRRREDVGVEIDVGVVDAVERVVVEFPPLARDGDLLVGT